MISDFDVTSFEPFIRLIGLDDLIAKIVSKNHTAYFNKFIPNREGIYNEYLQANNLDYYTTHQYIPVKKNKTQNRHQDLANFRLYFEWELIVRNFRLVKGIINAYIIDVGASTRLYNNNVARIILRPRLDVQDHIRTGKFINNGITHILGLTLQQFKEKYLQKIKKYKPIFNFTDTLYYIDDKDLVDLAEQLQIGIIGIGTMHIFKNKEVEDYIQPLLDLGYIAKNEHEINMKVLGNETTYRHIKRFTTLAQYDNYNIKANDFNITIVKQNEKDLGTTLYTSFIIVKTENTQHSISITGKTHSINKAIFTNFNYINKNLNAEKEQTISKTINDYKTLNGLDFKQLMEPYHIARIRTKITLNVGDYQLYDLIRNMILKNYLEEEN